MFPNPSGTMPRDSHWHIQSRCGSLNPGRQSDLIQDNPIWLLICSLSYLMMSVISDLKNSSVNWAGKWQVTFSSDKSFQVAVLSATWLDWSCMCFCQGLQWPFQIFYQVLGGETFFSTFFLRPSREWPDFQDHKSSQVKRGNNTGYPSKLSRRGKQTTNKTFR